MNSTNEEWLEHLQTLGLRFNRWLESGDWRVPVPSDKLSYTEKENLFVFWMNEVRDVQYTKEEG